MTTDERRRSAMKPDNRPQVEKVAASLRAEIMAGLLPARHQLTSIPRLAVEFGVSTATIQSAFKILKEEGLLDSRAGAGVYVREGNPFAVRAAAYFIPTDRGVTYKILDVSEGPAPADIAVALGEERAVLRHRLMLRAETPVELSRSYYPASWAAGTALAGRGKIRGGAPAVLAELGYPEREWSDRISCRPPTAEEAETLEIPQGVPILRQFRTVYSDSRRPVEVSVLIKPGHLYELEYQQVVGPA
ncbi:GntR family transcriptional regulator [Streptosporangium jomthongense]|uniref:GntR family transcriptional regulator n=1 Tax=Streptosporangium jomthongense TaxID=1193683 RepID=A0ABV8F5Z0_9ACTN